MLRAGGESSSYVVANLSAGGALLIGGPPPKQEGTLEVEIRHKGTRSMTVQGHVLHARPEGIGLAFEPLATDAALALDKLIAAVEAQNLMPPPLPAGGPRGSDELPPQAPRPDDAFFVGNDPRPPRSSGPDERAEYLRALIKSRDEAIRKGRTALEAVIAEADALRLLAGRLKSRLDSAVHQQGLSEVALATAREAAQRQLDAQLTERTAMSEQLEQEQRRTLEAIATVSGLEATVRRLQTDATHARDEAERSRREAVANAMEANGVRKAKEELMAANRKAMEAQAGLTKERNRAAAAEASVAEARVAQRAAEAEIERLKAEAARLKSKLVAAETALEKMATRKPAAKVPRGAEK